MNIIAVHSSSGKHVDSSVSPLKAAHAMRNLLVEVEVLDFEGEFMHKKHNPSRMIKSPADTQQLFRRGANLTVLLTPPLNTNSALDVNVPLLLIPSTGSKAVAIASAEKGTTKHAGRFLLSDNPTIAVGVSSIDFCPINNGTTIKLLVRVREFFTPAGVPMMKGDSVSLSRDIVLKQLLGSKLTVEFGKMETMRMASSSKAGLPHLKVAVGNSICIRQPSLCNPVFS